MAALPPHVVPVRVRLQHTDALGVVYHGRWADLCEDAHMEAFRAVGYTHADMLAGGVASVATRMAITYHAPVRLDDVLHVEVAVVEMTRVRFTVRYTARTAEDGRLAAVCDKTFAFVDTGAGRIVRVPQKLASAVTGYLPMCRLGGNQTYMQEET